MKTYVLQVRSGCEENVCRRLKAIGFDVFVPMKKMLIHRKGTWTEQIQPVFSQYVFLHFTPSSENYHLIRHIDGFVRFLGNGTPQPIISARESAWLEWLRNQDKPLEISKIFVSSSGAKFVLSGALKKYDGDVEYHLRQRRAVIQIEIMGRKRNLVLPVTAV